MPKELHYIDIHSHTQFSEYDTDRETVISRAKEASVGIINVGTDLESSKKAVELAQGHENVWAIVGLHPVDMPEEKFDYEAFKLLASHPKALAIGECGLDYFHSKPADMPRQRDIFVQQIKLANEVGKPLMLHVRNVKMTKGDTVNTPSAYQDALSILREYAKVPVNFHFFAGTVSDLKDIIDAGYYVSFTGVLTFTKDYDDLIKMVPRDKMMSETDAPFVSPTPYRGKRNEPVYVIEVVKAIARILVENVEVTQKTLVNNAQKFFNTRF